MLASRHVKLMLSIRKNKEIRCSKPNKDLDYLFQCGYIEITVCDKPGDFYAQPYLTEKGEAALDEFLLRKREIWIPVLISNILSIIAIVISIIALLKQ